MEKKELLKRSLGCCQPCKGFGFFLVGTFDDIKQGSDSKTLTQK